MTLDEAGSGLQNLPEVVGSGLMSDVEAQPAGGISMTLNQDQLRDFGRRYTGAWCSQDPAKV